MSAIDKIVKIIPMLASDVGGEVAAAASAISRMLAADGKDWHWLTSRVAGGSPSGADSLDVTVMKRIQDSLRRQLFSLTSELDAIKVRNKALTAEVERLRNTHSDRVRESNARVHRRGAGEEGPTDDPDVRRRQLLFRASTMLKFGMWGGEQREFLESMEKRLGKEGSTMTVRQAGWFGDLWKTYKEKRGRA